MDWFQGAVSKFYTSYFLKKIFNRIKFRILFFTAGMIIYRYIKSPTNSYHQLKGYTVIITAANSRIGRKIAVQVARLGARVIMACRDQNIANKFRDFILSVSKNADVVVKSLDITSEASIREFSADIIANEDNLHILVHIPEISIYSSNRRLESEYDVQVTKVTNHFGPFLLTHLLIDHMKQSKRILGRAGRIITVTSEDYKTASADKLTNLIVRPSPTCPYINYFISNYISICFTLELARRLRASDITANCLHPEIVTPIHPQCRGPVMPMLSWGIRYVISNREQGARTAVYLTCSDEVERVTGSYFMNCEKTKLSDGADNMNLARAVWEDTLNYVNLRDTDPRI